MKDWQLGGAACAALLAVLLAFWVYPPRPALLSFFNPSKSTPSGRSLLASTATPDLTTPDGFTIAFYQWYLNQFFYKQTKRNDSGFTSSLNQWFTPDYITQYNNWSNIDADPVLFASDWGTTWPSAMTAQIISQTSTDASVLLSLGIGSQLEQVHVSLMQTSNGWRISGISQN